MRTAADGVDRGTAGRGAHTVDPAGDAERQDRLVAHGQDEPPRLPAHVHRRLVVDMRRHSEHHVGALRQMPLRAPIDRLPVLRAHHGIHHGAEHRTGRHRGQPLDQRVQRRGGAALDHPKGACKLHSVKQAADDREIRTNRARQAGAAEGLERPEQPRDLRLARDLDERLGERDPGGRQSRSFPPCEDQAVHLMRESFRWRGGA